MVETLNHLRKNITSQAGEDGIIEFLCEKFGFNEGWCVEFGAWDGIHLSNTRSLVVNKEWSSVLIEGDAVRYKDLKHEYKDNNRVYPLCAFVGFDTEDVNSLDNQLAKTPIPTQFEVLSIDVDGNDYYIWEALQNYSPAIVIIEANSSFPHDIHFIGKPDSGDGSSAAALVELGKRKGYELVAHTGNCIFVQKERFKEVGLRDNRLSELFDNKFVKKPSLITKLLVKMRSAFYKAD